jgi:hypothetical protein
MARLQRPYQPGWRCEIQTQTGGEHPRRVERADDQDPDRAMTFQGLLGQTQPRAAARARATSGDLSSSLAKGRWPSELHTTRRGALKLAQGCFGETSPG